MGVIVGVNVGNPVGVTDGLNVGITVGGNVGVSVGEGVGKNDGSKVGKYVVGDWVGVSESCVKDTEPQKDLGLNCKLQHGSAAQAVLPPV